MKPKKKLVQKAGVKGADKTGYLRAYGNGKKLEWDPAACKKTNIDLLEYPVFWQARSRSNLTRRLMAKRTRLSVLCTQMLGALLSTVAL